MILSSLSGWPIWNDFGHRDAFDLIESPQIATINFFSFKCNSKWTQSIRLPQLLHFVSYFFEKWWSAQIIRRILFYVRFRSIYLIVRMSLLCICVCVSSRSQLWLPLKMVRHRSNLMFKRDSNRLPIRELVAQQLVFFMLSNVSTRVGPILSLISNHQTCWPTINLTFHHSIWIVDLRHSIFSNVH